MSSKAEKLRAMRNEVSTVAPIKSRDTVPSVEIGEEDKPLPKVKKEAVKSTASDDRTEPVFARVTKAEKRMLRLQTIDSGMKLQEVISAAITEYCKNHPV